jgi:hypothetical protein
MKNSTLKWLAAIIVIALILAFWIPFLRGIGVYFFRSPVVFALSIVGIVVIGYLVIFYKEIFFRRK